MLLLGRSQTKVRILLGNLCEVDQNRLPVTGLEEFDGNGFSGSLCLSEKRLHLRALAEGAEGVGQCHTRLLLT